ncbi:hypothetical protein DEU56DRAFT_761948 [Suillus clintonianus]|uniref:uncharacterized protein n=1 Tax=Suillus clintonianus TaxID=1904413 RepID=UPI001B87C720|nr:uncharacterized protein DEU56DRAFT_761948 [Suillus clintonianus]KAG2113386.1 hypothetical protein DEU56DRAFT_761948 [Suillus clintonianus]
MPYEPCKKKAPRKRRMLPWSACEMLMSSAVAYVPPGQEKRHWFWPHEYALFEEIETKDYDRAHCMPSKFHSSEPCAAQAVYFRKTVSWLRGLRSGGWIWWQRAKFSGTGHRHVPERCFIQEAIFELGVSQASLSMPEILWKYIDFEVDEQGDREKTRSLYERLVVLSGHHKSSARGRGRRGMPNLVLSPVIPSENWTSPYQRKTTEILASSEHEISVDDRRKWDS